MKADTHWFKASRTNRTRTEPKPNRTEPRQKHLSTSAAVFFLFLCTMAASASSQNVTFHCAYCTHILDGASTKRCGKCKRRAYCSAECQRLDWKAGQQHKNWCGVAYCEEDRDWAVRACSDNPKKGLGVFALRDIVEDEIIMVEAAYCSLNAHPALRDLVGETDLQKWHLNVLSCGETGPSHGVLCVRLSRQPLVR